jgi:hypothetical protein
LSGFKNLSNFGLNVDKIVLLALGIPIWSQIYAALLYKSKQARDILNWHSITSGVVADLRDLGPCWSWVLIFRLLAIPVSWVFPVQSRAHIIVYIGFLGSSVLTILIFLGIVGVKLLLNFAWTVRRSHCSFKQWLDLLVKLVLLVRFVSLVGLEVLRVMRLRVWVCKLATFTLNKLDLRTSIIPLQCAVMIV